MKPFTPVLLLLLGLLGCSNPAHLTAIPSSSAEPIIPRSSLNPEQQAESERRQILDAVLHDLLSNPRLADSRDWYGTEGDKQIGLDMKSTVPWPAHYSPSVPGYSFQFLNPDREIDPSSPRRLGITTHHFPFPPLPEPLKHDLYENHAIALALFNIGGRAGEDGVRGGGCLVFYGLKRQEGKWIVEYEGSLDP